MKSMFGWLGAMALGVLAVASGFVPVPSGAHVAFRPEDLVQFAVAGMAAATYNITKSGGAGSLKELWRKVQGTLREVVNFMFPEWDDFKAFKVENIDWSTREITAPLDINQGAGVASIVEGGWEARPSSPTVIDATWTWIHLNKRFTVSLMSEWIQQKNKAAMIASQMKFQGKKALEALGTWIADSFYGFSTGVRAKVSALANNTTTSITVTLKDMYGIAGLGSTGTPAPVSTLFRPDEYVAFVRAGALVANSFGQISQSSFLPNVPSFIVTFAVAPTLAADDSIVFANSLENTTLEGTDYLKSLVGFLEGYTSDTVLGVSATTYPKWAPGYADTAAGRLTPMKIRRMRQAVEQTGGGTLTDIRSSYGVENDLFAQLAAGVVFPGMDNLQVDGDFKIKGVKWKSSVKCPPGYVFGYDRNSIRKMVLLPEDPKAPTWGDGEKIPDRSGRVYPIDYPCQLLFLNRGNLAYASNKTEQ